MQQPAVEFIPVAGDDMIRQTAALADGIWHECFSELLSAEQIDYMVDKFQSEHAMADQIGNQGYEYFQMLVDGTPQGYVGVQAKDGMLLLSKLYMKSTVRGSGLGRKAIDFVEALARKRHCRGVWLTVNKYNARAIAVYEKTGFVRTREQIADIGNGFVMDDFIYEKMV